MQRIERRLVAGIGVDRRHEALLDADEIVQHLGDGGQAVGRARRVRDDDVVLGQLVVIDAVDDGQIGAVGRRRDEHAFGAGLEVGRRLVLRREDTRAFQRDIDAHRLVRQLGGIPDRGHLDRSRADVDRVALDGHLSWKPSVHAVEAQEMGVGLHGAEIVDRHDLDVRALGLIDRAQHVAADAAKPIDRDLDCHKRSPKSGWGADPATRIGKKCPCNWCSAECAPRKRGGPG